MLVSIFTGTRNKNSNNSTKQTKAAFPVVFVLGATIPCGFLLMLFVILLSISLYQRRRKRRNTGYAFSSAFVQSELDGHTEMNPIYCAFEFENLGLPENLNFSRENLTFIEGLGEGHFGKVLSHIS
jgi:hypothetical protein